jgi:Spy/CpxP family protein refolding chaperone
MKAMHTTLAALLLGTAMTGAAFAQTANTNTNANTQSAPQASADKDTGRGEHGMKALNLTDDQKKQIKQFHQDAKAQAAAIKKDQTLSADQRKAKLQELHQSTQDKVASVLTPEQKQKWDEMRANHKGKHHHHKKGATTQQPS